jgi:hypothetical protein
VTSGTVTVSEGASREWRPLGDALLERAEPEGAENVGRAGTGEHGKDLPLSSPAAAVPGRETDSKFACGCRELTDILPEASGKQCQNITKVLGNKFPICPQCGKVWAKS